MTIRGLQRLLLILGGKVAACFRALVETTFTRVMAGDTSLIKVIQANAESNEPGPRMARKAMASDPSPGGILPDDFLDDAVLKRKRAELELEERQVALEERRRALKDKDLEEEERRRALKDKDLGFVKSSIDLMKTLSRSGELDERTSMQYEELVRNTTFTGQKTTAEGGGAASDGISISVVARVMKYDCTKEQLQSIGKIMAKKYFEKYNTPPQKHKQMHDGMMIDVNSYMERDRGMMETTIKEYMERPQSTQKKNKSIKEFMGHSQPCN